MSGNVNDFVGYGTPAEQIGEDETLAQYASQNQLKAQKVTDKQGRVRFHGAFTGGFSAGFYNTVGSKDGWAPATYVSSRKKAEEERSGGQRPEDFMDDEDLEQFGIAPRQVRATVDYTQQNKPDRAAWDPVVPGLTQSITEMIRPAHMTVAIKLLGLMGWKQGQGIGPRVKRKTKESVNVVGPSLPEAGHDDDNEDDDEYLSHVTFAPKDMNPVSFDIKDDLHGIGYQALRSDLNVKSSRREEERLTFGGHSKGISGHAFGVGIEEDEDDNDIYGTERISDYDTVIGDEPANLHQHTHSKAYGRHRSQQHTLLPTSAKVLEGFCLAQKRDKPSEQYKVPVIPKHYRPKAAIQGASELPKIYGHMDRNVRGLLIGESVSVPVKAVISDSAASSQDALLPGKGHSVSLNEPKAEEPEQAKADSKLALPEPPLRSMEPLNRHSVDFKPFVKNPEKQARYERYLQLVRSGDRDAYNKVAPAEFRRHEKEREKEEFERSGKFFKDLTGVMASRFTRSKGNDEEDDNKVRVRIDEEVTELLDEKKNAVQMKMFGKLTRESYEWHPHRLLCKRFNVPDPYPDSQLVGLPVVVKDKISAYNFLDIESLTKTPDERKASTKPEDLSKQDNASSAKKSGNAGGSGPKSLSNGEKAPVDLFKAVFQDTDSEDSSSDEGEELKSESKPMPAEAQTSKSTSRRHSDKSSDTAASSSKSKLAELQKIYSQERTTATMYESESKTVEEPTLKVKFVPKKDRNRDAANQKQRKSRWSLPEDADEEEANVDKGTSSHVEIADQVKQEPIITFNNKETHTSEPKDQIMTEESSVTTVEAACDSSMLPGEDNSAEQDLRLNTDNQPQEIKGTQVATVEEGDEDAWMPALPPGLSAKPSAESAKDHHHSDTSSDEQQRMHKHKKSKSKDSKSKHRKSKKSHKHKKDKG